MTWHATPPAQKLLHSLTEMDTPERLAAITAWGNAYAAIQRRADKIAERLIPMPADLSAPIVAQGVQYSRVKAANDLRRWTVTAKRRDKRFEIINILTAHPDFQELSARRDASLRRLAA